MTDPTPEQVIREALEAATMLKAGSRRTLGDDACFALAELEAERDRLRAALEELAAFDPPILHAQRIARAALDTEGAEHGSNR